MWHSMVTTTPQSVSPQKHHRTFFRHALFRSTLRILLLDVPLLLLLVLYATTQVVWHVNEHYWSPLVTDLLPWRSRQDRRNELTYYGRICNANDQTAHSPEELVVDNANDGVETMLTHGISIIPNLIEPETAQALRESIIENNYIVKNFHVLEPENRYSYGIPVEQHPSVRQALHQISTHPVLQPLLQKVLGKRQALYKFHAITADYGAPEQNFHWDVIPQSSAAMYARSFAPIYSLFIPLQNTTAAMGSTEICPGTHICTGGTKFCRHTAFRASGEADLWPAGTGALMNQQMTHRGREHVDPHSGPRVLFILAFTVAPRVNHVHELETRSLSLGGSYAVHWTQWGHTDWDLRFGRMKMPWKLLRALGLYKTREATWGWDWITSVLVQVANGDYYRRNELEEHIENGGFAPIPKFLWPELPDENLKRGRAWYAYTVELIRNCKVYLQDLSHKAVAAYVMACLVWSLWKLANGGGRKSISTSVIRPLMMAGFVFVGYHCATEKIARTPWAQKILTRKMFQLSHNFRGPRLPSVIPLEQDVLLMDDMQSEYLASYTKLYDYGHPGNAAWNVLLEDYARGYDSLSTSLQSQLRDDLYLWNLARKSRMLRKNHRNQWGEMTEKMADDFIHEQLLRRARGDVETTIRGVDYLSSETKFGPWRETVMHTIHIPALLGNIKDKILHQGKPQASRKSEPLSVPPALIVGSHATYSTKALPPQELASTRSRIPPAETDFSEPFVGAWLQEGDVIEGRYKGKFNEWYQGRIIDVHGSTKTWTVQYYDGDFDYHLCQLCVRPFVRYREGEVVQYIANDYSDGAEEDWREARITRVLRLDDGRPAYDFSHTQPSAWDNVSARLGVTPTHIRRTRPTLAFGREFQLGQQVEARFYEQDEDGEEEHDGAWHRGWIVHIEEGKYHDTYHVEYEDGSDQGGLWSDDLRSM